MTVTGAAGCRLGSSAEAEYGACCWRLAEMGEGFKLRLVEGEELWNPDDDVSVGLG